MAPVPTAVSVGDLSGLLPSWARHLRAEKSPRTVQSYLKAAEQFVASLRGAGMPTEAPRCAVATVDPEVESFLRDVMFVGHELERASAE